MAIIAVTAFDKIWENVLLAIFLNTIYNKIIKIFSSLM